MRPASDGSLPAHQAHCLGCGPDNPASMGLRLRVDGERVGGRVTFDRRQEGAPGYAHGGAIATVLDDALGSVLMVLGRAAVTAKLEVDFRAPALIGQELELEAWCEREEERKLHLKGRLQAEGALVAEATALFVAVGLEHFRRSGSPLPSSWAEWAAPDGSAVPEA